MATYNGHRSWAAWNVSLWIGNDEGLYRLALECIKSQRTKGLAATKFIASRGWAGHQDTRRGQVLAAVSRGGIAGAGGVAAGSRGSQQPAPKGPWSQ